jgi:hypothetical protein
VRPKCHKYLGRWNKERGGGDGSPPSFQNYCDGNDTWLAWVFCLDYQQNFILLASSASSRLPGHLTKEGGFGENPNDSPHSASGNNTGRSSTAGRSSTDQKIGPQSRINRQRPHLSTVPLVRSGQLSADMQTQLVRGMWYPMIIARPVRRSTIHYVRILMRMMFSARRAKMYRL